MEDYLEELVRAFYKKQEASGGGTGGIHPAEEEIACFMEGRLSTDDAAALKAHLASCATCAELLKTQLRLRETEEAVVPQDLIDFAKGLVKGAGGLFSLEVCLKTKERFWELLSTTGDVVVGNELVPAPVLRGRKVNAFKDEITILKDIKDIRVEMKIENSGEGAFNLSVSLKERATSGIIKDLRVSLIKDDLELESYLAGSGRVVFEHVLTGRYQVEISGLADKIASILLDIRK